MYTLLYFNWITSKDFLYSIENSAQCYMAAWVGEEFGREWTCVYMAELFCSSPDHNIGNQLYSNIK